MPPSPLGTPTRTPGREAGAGVPCPRALAQTSGEAMGLFFPRLRAAGQGLAAVGTHPHPTPAAARPSVEQPRAGWRGVGRGSAEDSSVGFARPPGRQRAPLAPGLGRAEQGRGHRWVHSGARRLRRHHAQACLSFPTWMRSIWP